MPEQQLAGGNDQFFIGDGYIDTGIDRGENRIERDSAVGSGQENVRSRTRPRPGADPPHRP